MNTGLTLHHQVSIPTAVTRNYPVIFVLHGMGGNETNLPPILEHLRSTHLIISVRGPLTHGKGYAYFYPKSYGNPDRATFDPAVVALTQFCDDAIRQYPVDLERVFVVGFSQGSILGMTLSLATDLPIKGVAAMNGYIPQFIMEQAPKSVQTAYFVSQGETDPIFPLAVGRQTHAFLAPRSSDVTYVEYPVGHEISPCTVADLVSWLRVRS
jgi:phospholipase/carboxylesterase